MPTKLSPNPTRFSRQFASPAVNEKRRGVRLNSRVPILIEWKDAAEETLREAAFTRVVGPYGCLVVLPKKLDLSQSLRVINVATQQSNAAVVIWKGKQQSEGWEVGIELVQPPSDFWGLDL